MSDSTTPTGIEDRIRWRLLGFGSDDLSDIPLKRRLQYRDRLLTQLCTQSAIQDAAPALSAKTTRAIAVCVCSVLLIAVLATSVRSAIAGQRQNIRRDYAGQLMALVLDLYEEDQQVLTSQSARAELLLPDRSYWARNNTDEKRMYACAQAVQSLTTARMGFPDTSVVQLTNAKLLLDSQLDQSANADLDFVFHLIAGKAVLEALDTFGARGRLALLTVPKSVGREDAVFAIDHACTILELELKHRFSESEYKILRSALLIDWGRAEIRQIPANQRKQTVDFSSQLQRVRGRFDEAIGLLNSVEARDGRAAVQLARGLNNLLLLEQRCLRSQAELASEEFETLYLGLKAQLELAFAPEFPDGAPHANAILFERALCYSNLADLVTDARESELISANHPLLRESLELRDAAIAGLTRIPRICRTERHFENLVLNQSRIIATELQSLIDAGPPFAIPEFVRARAAALEFSTGNFLESNVGQFQTATRIAAALCLPEKYSTRQIEDFVSTNREFIVPANQQWIDQFLTDRLARENQSN